MTRTSTTLFTPNARPEAVFFDLDGTLADTAPDLGAAANRLRQSEGLPALPLEHLRPHTSHGVRGMLLAAFSMTPAHTAYAEYAERFLTYYAEHICEHTRLFEQMAEVLDRLDASGTKWGIVTNKRHQYTQPLVTELGLMQRAHCVISGDTAARPKPAPDPLLLACELTDTHPQNCVYVGDDVRDIQAGRAAGMVTAAAAYGYLGIDHPLTDWNAHFVIQSPIELLPACGL
ncbi:MAG: phosphoglycolate phosphatase [Rhodocyclaceae bacterium]